MFKKLLFSIAFICFNTIFAQQSINVKGHLQSSITNEIIPFAIIKFEQKINRKDSIVAVESSDENGDFNAQFKSFGLTKLTITADGYLQYTSILPESSSIDLGKVTLEEQVTKLEDITIVSEKEQSQLELNKRSFNVEKNLNAIGGTAENVLKNIPSVNIDANGNAILRNATATIYVNGKPTQLTLAQIPANTIESVEVISNPSAKYDASAAKGIINLVLKQNKKKGLHGNASVGIGTSSRYNVTLNLDYGIKKWGFTTMYNFNSLKPTLAGYADKKTETLLPENVNYYNQNTQTQLNNVFQNGRLGIDYFLNKKNTLSVAGNIAYGQYNNLANQQYVFSNQFNHTTNYGTRTTKQANYYHNIGAELEWKKTFSRKGKSLALNSGYSHNNMSNAADWFTSSYDSTNTTTSGFPEVDKISGNTIGDQLVAQLEYATPINDSSRLEIGTRLFNYVRDQQYFFNQLNNSTNEYQLITNYSQNANITERINAIYAIYNIKLKHNFELQAGLRFEQSILKGVSHLDASPNFGYNYPSSDGKNLLRAFFPSLDISKKIDETSELGFNITRKIGRPGWRQFFVGIQASDRQNITIGNPALQPEFESMAELNYHKKTRKLDWLSTLYYEYESNTIKPLVNQLATDSSVLVTTFINAKADIRTGIDNTLSFTLFKNLKVMAGFNGFNVSLQTDSYTRTLWAYNAKLNLTYKLPYNLTVQLNMANNSKFPQLQGYRYAVRSVDVSVKKGFAKNKINVVVALNDIFNSGRQITVYDQGQVYQKTMTRREIRYLKISAQYSFGGIETKKTKKQNQSNEMDIY